MAVFSRALGFLVAPFVEFSFLLTSCYTRIFVVLAFWLHATEKHIEHKQVEFQIVLSRSTGLSESADKEISERILTPRARKMTMRVKRGKKATGTKGGKAKGSAKCQGRENSSKPRHCCVYRCSWLATRKLYYEYDWLENLPTAFWNQRNLLGKNFVEHVWLLCTSFS